MTHSSRAPHQGPLPLRPFLRTWAQQSEALSALPDAPVVDEAPPKSRAQVTLTLIRWVRRVTTRRTAADRTGAT